MEEQSTSILILRIGHDPMPGRVVYARGVGKFRVFKLHEGAEDVILHRVWVSLDLVSV